MQTFFHRSAKMHRISLLNNTNTYGKETQVRTNLKTTNLINRDFFLHLTVFLLTPVFLITGLARSAWRITVRQLESMIRLSEGMARLYCQDEVS